MGRLTKTVPVKPAIVDDAVSNLAFCFKGFRRSRTAIAISAKSAEGLGPQRSEWIDCVNESQIPLLWKGSIPSPQLWAAQVLAR